MKFFCALSLFALNSAFAWGPIGHRVVGEIASRRLTPEVTKKVTLILEGQTLADVSTWADLIRSDPSWKKASPWHYVNIEDGKKYKDRPPYQGGDVIWSVEHFAKILKDQSSTAQERKEALSFLVHFVGDLHQPLHVSRQKDLGGNTIKMKWFGESTNLHEIWDEKLIELEQMSFREYADFIDKGPHSLEPQWAQAPLMTWVQESMELRPLVYDYPKNVKEKWEYDYRFKTYKAMNERLLKAGVRLAQWLNENLK